jgi:hypothetical protein
MAYSIPIGGIVRHVVYCTIAGQASTNTRKWQLVNLSSGSVFPSPDTLDALDTGYAANVLPLLSSNSTYYGSQLYLMNPLALPPRPEHTTANQGAGTAGAGLLPGQTSGLVSLYTPTLGKIGQGRTYVPFPCPDDNAADGTPTAGYVTRLAGLAAYLKTDRIIVAGGQTATFKPCLYRGGADVPRFFDNAVNHDAWATQRRRGAFGRLNKAPF